MPIGPTELIVLIGASVVPAVALSKIAAKAGLSRWVGLTQLFPVISMIGLLYVAFTEWPNKTTPG